MFVYKFWQWSKFLRELFFHGNLFCGSWKNYENPKNLTPEKISATRYVSTCDVSGFFDSLLCDYSHARLTVYTSHTMAWSFLTRHAYYSILAVCSKNVSPCGIMWTIKQSLFIYLSGYGSCHVRQAWCHARRRRAWLVRSAILFWFKHYRINFCDKLRFLLDPKYLSREKQFL